MDYRLGTDELVDALKGCNRFLKRKIHLIACGGTAMTLAGVKPSTKDVDFMVPNTDEHEYLVRQLKALGYKSVSGAGWRRDGDAYHFDLFSGNRIHTTELLQSPLENGRNEAWFELSRIYVGILNDYDLIASKLMRGTRVDYDDCLTLLEAHMGRIDVNRLVSHYRELVSYDISEDRIRKNIEIFLEMATERGIYEK